MITKNDRGNLVYKGDTFEIELFRYTDPDRLNLADSAALYLGKEDTENIRRPLSIIKQGHALEIFRGESATFKFYNVSKEVYDHLITYKTMNMRVAGGNRANISRGYTMPSDKMKDEDYVRKSIEWSLENYHELINGGETPQVARSAMPINSKMAPFKLQFNFQTLIQALFVQRIWEAGAQGNTVKVVRGMYELVSSIDENLWDTVREYYGPHVKEWRDALVKLRKDGYTVGDFIADTDNPDTRSLPLEAVIRAKFGKTKSMW